MRKIKNPFTLFIQFFYHKITSAHYCSSVNGKGRFDSQLLSACSLLSFCNIGQMVKTECCVQIRRLKTKKKKEKENPAWLQIDKKKKKMIVTYELLDYDSLKSAT